MWNRGTAAIELGAVIALFVGLAIAKSAYDGARAPVTQPLSRAQSLLSATEVRRLSDLQQLSKYFLQNWRDRPTRPNLD
jgi:hypothetical protein